MSTLTRLAVLLVAFALQGCAQPVAPAASAGPVRITLLAFNDFHGHLLPPHLAIPAPAPGAPGAVAVPAGGAAWLASAIDTLAAGNPNHAIVSAGDLVGASPLESSLFLDEPTIAAMNLIGLDFNAVGNHEFDRGQAELRRLQDGGCERYTAREPCAVDKQFPGARFRFLAANVRRAGGATLFPATGIKAFRTPAATVRVGFIGMTLRGTPSMVTPSGVRGLTFADEADTANALVPALRAQGANAIVLLIHEGGATTGGYDDHACPGLAGDIVPILKRLDPAIDVVVSGHTHRAYICDVPRADGGRPLLLTSAGQYGTLLTDIELAIDPAAGRLTARSAHNVIVQSQAFVDANARTVPVVGAFPRFAPEPAVAALVDRYARAAAPLAQRVVGSFAASVTREANAAGESALGDLVADAQLAATSDPEHGAAQLALTNSGGLRADVLVPAGGGPVTYGQLYAAQPFGNTLVVKTLTGAQLRSVLEQQSFASSPPRLLQPSRGFSYSYDSTRPAGSRVTGMRLDAAAVDPTRRYRVTMNSFLASGGDGYTGLAQGTTAVGGALDVDALEAYVAAHRRLAAPATDRIVRER